MMQNKNYSEIAYLMRANGANINNVVGIDIEKRYTIKCNGVKISSNAKKATPHKIDAFYNLPKNTNDISIEARLQRRLKKEFMDAKMKAGRRKKQ